MNFFERQAQMRGASRRLVMLFGVAVAATVAALCAFVVALVWLASPDDDRSLRLDAFVLLHPWLFGVTAVVATGMVLIASLMRTLSLRGGGGSIARRLGGTQVTAGDDAQLCRLRNVVEEVAIAAGAPLPEIYVLTRENGINAFAAGYAPDDAAIVVTRGALERLNRDELQGVIAHEFCHVLNGDMRLNVRLMGMLHGLLVIPEGSVRLLNNEDAHFVFKVFAFALMMIGSVGLIFARLIKAGVSRSREYLADASAVQLTRQTRGIAGALKKIAGLRDGAQLRDSGNEEVSHMLFGDGLGLSGLAATHPPLLERIRALEPQFDADGLFELQYRWEQRPPSGIEEDEALGLAAGHSSMPLPAPGARIAVSPAAVAAHVARSAVENFQHAARIHSAIPPLLEQAMRTHDGAMPLVLALLLVWDPAVRERQRTVLEQALDASQRAALRELLPTCESLHPLLRLPLASLAMPALRGHSRRDVDRFLQIIDALIHADGAVGVFEYCLGRLLRRQLVEARDPWRHRVAGPRKLSQCLPAIAELMAVLATHGHAKRADAVRAFAAGMQRAAGEAIEMPAVDDWMAALDRALAALDGLDPFGKQMLIEGLTAVIAHDGRVYVPEAELLRTVCAFLHCPVPPLLEDAKF